MGRDKELRGGGAARRLRFRPNQAYPVGPVGAGQCLGAFQGFTEDLANAPNPG